MACWLLANVWETAPPDSQASIDLVAPSIPVVDLLVRTRPPATISSTSPSDHLLICLWSAGRVDIADAPLSVRLRRRGSCVILFSSASFLLHFISLPLACKRTLLLLFLALQGAASGAETTPRFIDHWTPTARPTYLISTQTRL